MIYSLLGILIGDACGSPYEGGKVTGNKIGSYTDDTEQAYGIALWMRRGKYSIQSLSTTLKEVFTSENRGYGHNQAEFLKGNSYRKDSYGNGSAMRVAPIGELCNRIEDVIRLSKLQSQLTHNHPFAVRGAITIALLTYLLKKGSNPKSILDYYPQALLPEKNKTYSCSLEAGESVPPAIQAFQTSSSFEDCLQKALAFGGDTDTIAATACALAAVRYSVPKQLLSKVRQAHPDNETIYQKIKRL